MVPWVSRQTSFPLLCFPFLPSASMEKDKMTQSHSRCLNCTSLRKSCLGKRFPYVNSSIILNHSLWPFFLYLAGTAQTNSFCWFIPSHSSHTHTHIVCGFKESDTWRAGGVFVCSDQLTWVWLSRLAQWPPVFPCSLLFGSGNALDPIQTNNIIQSHTVISVCFSSPTESFQHFPGGKINSADGKMERCFISKRGLKH